MDVQKVTLGRPIEFGEEVISELVFEEPTIGGLEELDRCTGDVARLIKLVSICTGLTPPQVKMIRAGDLEKVKAALGKLMPAGLQAGET